MDGFVFFDDLVALATDTMVWFKVLLNICILGFHLIRLSNLSVVNLLPITTEANTIPKVFKPIKLI